MRSDQQHRTLRFPPLCMTAAEKARMRQAAHAFLDQEIAAYMQFAAQHPERRPSRDDWRLLSQMDELRVYKVRKSNRSAVVPTAAGMSVLLGTGIVTGSASDCVYGAFARTREEKQIAMACTGQASPDAAVLLELEEPTSSEPCRSMKIMWRVSAMKGPLRMLVKPHDSVFVEATGMVALPTGERVGYELMHSITLRELPVLKEYTRIKMSMCLLWREREDASKTELYMRAFIDLQNANAMATSLALRDVARSFASYAKYAQVGKMKKLAWMLLHDAPPSQPAAHQDYDAFKACTNCGLGSESSRRRRRSASCDLCSLPICAKCRVVKHLTAFSLDRRLQTSVVAICSSCWHEVDVADAAAIALAELRECQACGIELEHAFSYVSRSHASPPSPVHGTSGRA